ncbi:MAG: RDD family protein [Alphaproteobacteria bacterium]|nr:RDD family protein [Alphaproteobacteria bacterium]MCW5743287.1 RDD family protein [Alphaproteobacteria bacterium]
MTDALILDPQAPDPRRRELTTPEGVQVHVKLASIGERLGALAVDIAVLIVAFIVMVALVVLGGGHLGIAFATLILFLLRCFYFTLFELAWNGRTLGKRATRLRVVNRRGGALAPSAVIARNLMREVELFAPISLAIATPQAFATGRLEMVAAFVWVAALACLPLFNRDRLRAGDMVAGTWVIVEPRPALLPDLARMTGGVATAEQPHGFTPAQLAVYGVKELQVLEELLRATHADVSAARRDVAQRIIRRIGYEVPDQRSFDATRFLEAFYAAQRGRLETDLAFGRRKRDKFDR